MNDFQEPDVAKPIHADVTTAIDAGDWEALHPTARAILDAAAAMIDADGEPALRLDVVSQQLQISTPAIYRYFGGRNELLDAAQAYRLREAWGTGAATLTDVINSIGSRDEFRAAAGPLFAAQLGGEAFDRLLVRAGIYGSARTRPVLMARIRKISELGHQQFTAVLTEAHNRGLIQPRLPVADVADYIAAAYFGQLLWHVTSPERDRTDLIAVITDTIDHLLFGGRQTPQANHR